MNILSRPALLKLLSAACLLVSPLFLSAQTKRSKPAIVVNNPKTSPNIAPTVDPTPTPEPPKKNGRSETKANTRPVSPGTKTEQVKQTLIDPAYHYEFVRPEFPVSKVVIEHDEKGSGTIAFQKKDFDETVTDPLTVSADALKRINDALIALNFLDSSADYQYEKDYSHLGNITIRIKKEGKERTTKFNWTLNKDAKALMDEYRKLSNQYVWKFDIMVARENQPLDSPRLMDEFDSLFRRNELSDAKQMVPFLAELGNDERIPLIARNHAIKLAKEIEKNKK
jgi:hypothetical protein